MKGFGRYMVTYFLGRQSITCGCCGLTSHHPQDVANLYCGHCHIFHDPLPQRLNPLVRELLQAVDQGVTHPSLDAKPETTLQAWKVAVRNKLIGPGPFLTPKGKISLDGDDIGD